MIFALLSHFFCKKLKFSYSLTRFPFGIGIWIWAVENLGYSHLSSVVRGCFHRVKNSTWGIFLGGHWHCRTFYQHTCRVAAAVTPRRHLSAALCFEIGFSWTRLGPSIKNIGNFSQFLTPPPPYRQFLVVLHISNYDQF